MGLDLRTPNERQIAIDFTGPKLASLPDGVVPDVEASCGANASIIETQAFQLPTNGQWRVMMKMQPKAGNQDPVDLRCVLKRGEEVLTETWTYLWSPP
jgi:glucans biosynthesis protein